MTKVKLALVGAGVIGKRHLGAMVANDQVDLVGIADPFPGARQIADELSVSLFQDTKSLLDNTNTDGVVIATPTEHHYEPAIECLDAGVHVLIEKPISATIEEAEKIVSKSAETNLQVLVGHHRRHYGLVNQARDIIQNGTLGQLVAVTGQWNVRKSDEYYAQEWRRKWQAGPILTNLIHDMDLLRYLAGDISNLMAETTNFIQGFEKEDAAALLMQFKNGALGTFILSDQSHSPWTWEQATGETAAFPYSGQNPLRFMGTKGSLEFPNLKLWQTTKGNPEWHSSFEVEDLFQELEDAFVNQINHFVDVIRGKQRPRITAKDASETLRATLAVYEAAKSGHRVTL